jgi:hypothetical protein
MFCRFLILLLFLAIPPTPGFSQGTAPATYQHSATGISFPARLGALTYRGNVDYAKQGRADLGVAVRYGLAGAPVWADIYVYDLGRKNLGTGLDSPDVQKAFNGAVQDIFALEKQKVYKSVQKTEEGKFALTTQSGRLNMLWAHFTYERLPGPQISHPGPLISELYLTAYRNQFLKIRFTSPAEMQERHQEALQKFLGDFGKILN